MKISWVAKTEMMNAVNYHLRPANIVLDVGPGIRPQTLVEPHVHICVDAHLPYIERLQQELGDDGRYVFLNCTWETALSALPAKSVDSVFAIDVIEHLEKEDGLRFLREAERVARCQVVIFTPLGFYPQPYDPGAPDRWGMDGGYWQTHRSGWLPEDFGDQWEFVGCKTFHEVDHNEQPLDPPHGAFWAFRGFDPERRKGFSKALSYGSPAGSEQPVKAILRRKLSWETYRSMSFMWRAVRHLLGR